MLRPGVTRKVGQGAFLVCVAALIVCLGALTAAFLLSLQGAQFYFDRAALAQEQLAAVAEIEATASRTGRAPAALVESYLRSTESEKALLARNDLSERFDPREDEEAKALARFLATDVEAISPNARAAALEAAHDLVVSIGERERAEARETAGDMAALRARMSLLGVAIGLIAAGLTLAGSWWLLSANQNLARLVSARTAALEERNSLLATIDKSRRLFFAKVSHELRTPVTVMRGEAEVSLADPDEGPQALRAALLHVVANTESLERRLAELLAVARAEDGQIQLKFASFDLGAMVREVKQEAERFAASNNVTLALDLPAEPLLVTGDRRWLGQALISLIDNGVRFSPTGGTLFVRMSATAAEATIEVEDCGVGAPAPELPRLFDAFYQTKEGRARGGSGLGLALTRWLVERHEGSVRVSNGPKGGCVFAVALPVSA
jgi:signal transduction histidine kinase